MSPEKYQPSRRTAAVACGSFQYPEHDLRAAHDEFAGFAGRNLVPVARSTMRHSVSASGCPMEAGRFISGGAHVADVGHRRSFGHAVSLIDADAGEAGEAAGKFGSEWRGAGLDPANFVIFGEDAGFGGLAQRIDGGRDHGHHGDAFLNQKSAQLLQIEAGHQNERGAERQGKSQSYSKSIDVVERQEAEHDVVGREKRGVRAEDLIDIRDQVVVREHDALGQSGGAAGVGKGGDISCEIGESCRASGNLADVLPNAGRSRAREIFAACALVRLW